MAAFAKDVLPVKGNPLSVGPLAVRLVLGSLAAVGVQQEVAGVAVGVGLARGVAGVGVVEPEEPWVGIEAKASLIHSAGQQLAAMHCNPYRYRSLKKQPESINQIKSVKSYQGT